MREQEWSTSGIQTQGPQPQKPFPCIQLPLGPVGRGPRARLALSSVVVDAMKHFRLVRNNHLPPGSSILPKVQPLKG